MNRMRLALQSKRKETVQTDDPSLFIRGERECESARKPNDENGKHSNQLMWQQQQQK